MIAVESDRCTGCGACVGACSFDAISLSETLVAELDWQRCRDCGACLSACPVGAITMREDAIVVAPARRREPVIWSTLALVAGAVLREVGPLLVEWLVPAASRAATGGILSRPMAAATLCGRRGSRFRRRHRGG